MTSDSLLHARIKALRSEIVAYARACQQRMEAIEAKYSPDQTRAPRGSSDGGQWTDGSGSGDRQTGVSAGSQPVGGSGSIHDSSPKPGGRNAPLKVDTAIQYLHRNVSSERWGKGRCAMNVANAIRASGIPLGRPATRRGERAREPWARDYGQILEDAHFSQISKNDSSGKYPPRDYTPQKGDVVVIQPISGKKPIGHIAMYDGRQWVSDFRQDREIWPNVHYEQQGADYKIYRHPNKM